MVACLTIDNGKDVVRNAMALEPIDRLYHAAMAACATDKGAIPIVVAGGPVQANPDEKVIAPEKARPLFVQQQAIGLQPIADRLARKAVTLFQRHHPLEKVEPAQRRLASLPAKDRLGGIQAHPLADHGFQHLVAHAMPGPAAVGVSGALVVKAIRAMQIAIRRGGLDQQTAWGQRLHHSKEPPSAASE